MKIQSSNSGYIQPSMDNSSQIKKTAENSELSFFDFVISYISNPTFKGEVVGDTKNNNQLLDFSSTEMETKSPEFEQLAQKVLGLIGDTKPSDQIKSLFGKTEANFTSEISENIESIIKTFSLTEDLGIEHSSIKEVIAEKLKLFSPEEIKSISINSGQKESNIVIEPSKISQTIDELIKLSENYKNTNNSVKQIILTTAENASADFPTDFSSNTKTKVEIPVSEKPVFDKPTIDKPIIEKPIINNKVAELEDGKEFKVEPKVENKITTESKITAEQKPTLTNWEKDVQISAKTKAEIPVSEKPIIEKATIDKPIIEKPIINNKVAELENGKEIKVEPKAENKITTEQKPTLTNLEKDVQISAKTKAEIPVSEKPIIDKPIIEKPISKENIIIENKSVELENAKEIKVEPKAENKITTEQKPTLTNWEKDVQISAKTKAEIPVSEKPIIDKPIIEKPISKENIIIENKSSELENGKEFKVEPKAENKITAEQKPTLTNWEKLNKYSINPEIEQVAKNELKQNKDIHKIVNSNVANILQKSKPNQTETFLTKDNDISNSSYFKTSGVGESNKSENYNFAQNKSNNPETYLPNQKEVGDKLEVELSREQIYTKPSGYMDEIKTFNNQVKPTKFATFTNVKFEDVPQYVEKMTKVLKNGETYKATMQLKPENLGSIFVNLSMKDDVLNIVIKANTSQTIDKLDSSAYQLKDALISQGFKSENIILKIENNSPLEQNYTTQYSDERNGKQENNKEWREFLNIIRNYSKNEDKMQQQEVVV